MIERLSTARAEPVRRSGRRRVVAAIAVTVWLVSVLMLVAGLAVSGPVGPGDLPLLVATILTVLSPVTVGAILVTRLPRNLIGWLLVASGLLAAISNGGSGLADAALGTGSGGVPGAIWFAVLANLTWVPLIVLLGFYLPLPYPSGHLPSRRWRPVAPLGIIAIAFSTISNATAPFSPGTFPAGVQNPLVVGGSAGDLAGLLGAVSSLIGVVALPIVAVSLVVRYRGAAALERQQLKWLAAVIAVVGPALAIAILTGSDTSGIGADMTTVAWLIVTFGFGLLPVAIGIAVLRYRLYDIDRLISRTLGYGVLAALLAAAYGGSILLLSAVLAPVTGENTLAVAGSTLLVAALFSPVRRGVQSVVDRRFNRARYDAGRELADLSQRLRGQVDLNGVQSEVLGTVSRTLAPSTASIWLRDRH